MPEHLTAAELRERLDLDRNEFDRLQRAKVWPRARTKEGDRFPWPEALHKYIAERERVARTHLPESISGEQLGELINRTSRTLHNYQKAGIPHSAEGRSVRYPIVAAVRWCLDNLASEKGGEGKEPSVAKQKEHEDLLAARAKRMQAEIDLAERQGKIVTVDFMRAETEETFAALRDVLLNLPGDHADSVLGLTSRPKARAVLRGVADKAMTALRDGLTRVADRQGSELDETPEIEEAHAADDAP